MNPLLDTLKANYALERYKYGWLVLSTDKTEGVPIDGISEISSFAGENAQMVPGICHYYKYCQGRPAVFAIANDHQAGLDWAEAIENSLENVSPQKRWWIGTNVGTSSASIFSTFCEESLSHEATRFSGGSIPADIEDFKLCQNLLSLFPEWKNRLGEVGANFPNSDWDLLAKNWDALEHASHEGTEAFRDALHLSRERVSA